MISKTQQAGYSAEKTVLKFLRKKGLKLVCQNYLCRYGEIDIIMRDQQHLVFIEVRKRNNPDYGSPLASITLNKQQKILRTAQHYLQTHPKLATTPCRFDAVGLSGDQPIQWIPNAFQIGSHN